MSRKFKLNRKGVQELLRSNEMMEVVEKRATEIKGRLGSGYSTSTYKGKTRVNASVKAETYKAKKDNYKNNTILKALK